MTRCSRTGYTATGFAASLPIARRRWARSVRVKAQDCEVRDGRFDWPDPELPDIRLHGTIYHSLSGHMEPRGSMNTLRAIACWLTLAFLVLLARGVTSIASADCPDATIDIRAVQGLIGAEDVAALDALFAKCNAREPALVAVYRKRRLALRPTDDEERTYLRSLPTTKADVRRIYELTHCRDISEDPRIADVVYGMFGTAADLVKKHGTYHRRFITLCVLTDGEVGESAWNAFDWLLEHDTDRTVAALRSLPKDVRTRICNAHDPRDLTKREAATRCRSGL
jgi:hypothetical protein